MKKATRSFLKQRPEAKFVVAKQYKLDGALMNHCFQNAAKLTKTNENELLLVSGWLIGDFLGELGTAIIPHYWVFNEATNVHYDPTPIDDSQAYDYVLDFDIFKYGSKDSYLPLPLKLSSDGKFQARKIDGKGYVDLDRIDVKHLYELKSS